MFWNFSRLPELLRISLTTQPVWGSARASAIGASGAIARRLVAGLAAWLNVGPLIALSTDGAGTVRERFRSTRRSFLGEVPVDYGRPGTPVLNPLIRLLLLADAVDKGLEMPAER